MKQKPTKRMKMKIHIGPYGGVRVDPDEFFARPDVQARLERMRKLDIVGKKIVGNKILPSERAQ